MDFYKVPIGFGMELAMNAPAMAAYAAMSEAEKLTLLASDGMLVKRPLMIADDTVLVGFKEAEWAEKL